MTKEISLEEFDRVFDEGKEDVTEYLDLDNTVASRPDREVRKVNVDMPVWMVEALDKEAKRVGIGRQAVIKMWLAERLDEEARRSA